MSLNSSIKINGEFQYSLLAKDASEKFHKAAIEESREKLRAEQKKEREEKAEAERRRHIPFVRKHEKVGRNNPCPCGSGKKFKKCCMRK